MTPASDGSHHHGAGYPDSQIPRLPDRHMCQLFPQLGFALGVLTSSVQRNRWAVVDPGPDLGFHRILPRAAELSPGSKIPL